MRDQGSLTPKQRASVGHALRSCQVDTLRGGAKTPPETSSANVFGNCLGCLCFEYDHIIPYSKGGESTAENCQILQTGVNRFKSNKDGLDSTQLKGYSCDINFTDKELDVRLFMEMLYDQKTHVVAENCR